ncbi:MAG TPA: outer membrane beta-barrel protein [Polyangia bacterium]|nr:outer membrane beta-barrel protein [Polyangia bacterium]
MPVASAEPAGMNSVVERPGFDFGLRLGYAIPMGSVFQNATLSDGISGAIPFVLEAAYRITPNFSVGGLFQYAVAQTKNCPSSCSASVMRFGVEGIYNVRSGGAFDPWLGLGVGYEQLSLSVSGVGDGDYHGFEFATIHAGGDYRMAPNFALGPFVSFSLAQYSGVSSGGQSADIPNTAMHEWLQLGIRGLFSI